MKAITWLVLMSGLTASVACRDQKPPPKPRPQLPLLGKKSEAAIAHFESTCPGRFTRVTSPPVTALGCTLRKDLDYRVVFQDEQQLIRTLEISGTLAEALEIYDRAFAPIVPDETREILRRSLKEPKVGAVFRKSTSEVSMHIDVERARQGDSVLMMWDLLNTYLELAPVP